MPHRDPRHYPVTMVGRDAPDRYKWGALEPDCWGGPTARPAVVDPAWPVLLAVSPSGLPNPDAAEPPDVRRAGLPMVAVDLNRFDRMIRFAMVLLAESSTAGSFRAKNALTADATVAARRQASAVAAADRPVWVNLRRAW